MQYEKNNSILPNVSAEFAKLCANGKTAIVAQILHQYHEKEWSNISEGNFTNLYSNPTTSDKTNVLWPV